MERTYFVTESKWTDLYSFKEYSALHVYWLHHYEAERAGFPKLEAGQEHVCRVRTAQRTFWRLHRDGSKPAPKTPRVAPFPALNHLPWVLEAASAFQGDDLRPH